MIVGIDIGTQSVKAVICSPELQALGYGVRTITHRAPQPGHCEQSPTDWLNSLAPAIADALKASGLSAASIVGVGITGQLDGCVAVDQNGSALGPALIWMDRRATAHVPNLPADFLDRTGQVADPSHMAAKISWLKHEGTAADCFHQPTSFVVHCLTGAKVLDPGHASTTMLFNSDAADLGDWDDELLECFSIDRSELPAIARATSVAGQLNKRGAALTGLPIGTPVSVGTGDDFSTPLGAGLTSPGPLACVLGTAEVVGAVCRSRVLDREGLLETHNYLASLFFLENPGWLAGGSIRWAMAALGISSEAEFDALAASSTVGAGGVRFIPALGGAMSPIWEPSARACFYGMSVGSTRADLARAVLEGCAFAMRDVVLRLGAMALAPTEILLLGGGSRSSVWAQIRADVSGLEVGCAKEIDSAALGAAAIASVAVGVQSSIEDCASLLEQVSNRYAPTPDATRAYRDHHAQYRELFQSLRPLF